MEIVRRTLARYASLETYVAEGVVREDKMETRFSIRLARPDSYRVVWRKTVGGVDREGAVWSAKEGPRVRLDKLAFGPADDLEALSSTGGNSSQATVTVPFLFFPALQEESALRLLAGFELQGTEEIGGEPCYLIAAASPQGDRTQLWISKKRLLVLQMRTKTATETYSDIRVDGALTSADFAYELPQGVVLEERRTPAPPRSPRADPGKFELTRVRDVLAAPVRLFGEEVEREHAMETMAWLLAGAGSVKGVERSAIIDALPGPRDPKKPIFVMRLKGDPPSGVAEGVVRVVSPGYFATVGLGISAGRAFTEKDGGQLVSEVAVINATMARHIWPGLDPVGNYLKVLEGSGSLLEIVGVVEDGPEARGVSEVYILYTQAPTLPSVFLLVRAAEPPQAVAVRLQELLLAEELPYGEVRSLEEVLAGPPASP